MEEVTYLQAGDVSVTSARIQIGSQTFATRNVGSVRIDHKGRAFWPLLLVMLGVFLMFGAESRVFGFLLAAIVLALWWWGSKPKATLVLLAGGGEVKALTSTDKAAIDQLHAAVVQAISAR